MATHFYLDGHTYEIETAPLTWDAADLNASALTWDDDGSLGVSVSAYLTNVGSSAENAILLKNVKASVANGVTVAADGGGADYLWLGASDASSEGAWQWTDGSALSASYQNWGSGTIGSEPDNFNGDQDYLAIGAGRWPANGGGIGEAGQWNDLSGSNQLWSIIEWDGLIGTSASEKLTGTSRDDVIDGNAGNDNIKGGDGNDAIYAGDGNDKVDAGNGDNSIIAETGIIHSDDGNDAIKSGNGDDFIAAGTGDDVIKAGDGNNVVVGANGNDQITTGSGNDIINIDGIYVDDGEAAEGNDIIKTGAGDDFIVVSGGFDKVWGGGGQDVFFFNEIQTEANVTTTVEDGKTVSTLNIHRVFDFDAGASGGSVDSLAFDSLIFESLAGGINATNFVKGKGMSAASANETGVDDYLIFDSGSGKLYYDADGNQSGSEAVLIGIIKGKTADLNFEDISIF